MKALIQKASWLSFILVLFTSLILLTAGNATAEEDGEEGTLVPEDCIEGDLRRKCQVDEITVTGSRLKRDTFSSIAPLQVITSQVSREAGLIDAAAILQDSTASTGQQIDLSFSGFVLDNGPGSTNVNLRGLGSARSLVLLNGRRISPAGVEGAPSSPDLGLIPRSLVQQYDILLDGASSVYGSDAVAGVANAILRKDFDGLELELFSGMPSQANGDDHTFRATWGTNTDRGFVGVGLDYSTQDNIRYSDREWTAGCRTSLEVDENGNRRTTDLAGPTLDLTTPNDCVATAIASRIIIDPVFGNFGFGSVYYIPGQSNTGIPNFNESGQFGLPADTNGDGVNDIGSFADFSRNGQQDGDLIGKGTQLSVMAYGEHTFEGESNITPFFEVLYAKRTYEETRRTPQLFPFVPATNPFNPCGVNGQDCGLAWDTFMTNPQFEADVLAAFGGTPTDFGLLSGPVGPQRVRPVLYVDGDRNGTDVEVDQLRVVAGVKGDIPALQFGSLSGWSFEGYVSHTKSSGQSSRLGIREDRLNFALGVDPNTGALLSAPCVANAGSPVDADVTNGCVPVNLFAPSLYQGGLAGDFATAAERNYVFDSRDFDTDYEQTIASLYLTGSVYELPAGSVQAGLGLEYRLDDISSKPDAVARDGLFFGFFSDGGAVGDKTTEEAFAEIEFPLLANVPGVSELNLNLSTRLTKDEFYGSESTYSAKIGWRPVDSLFLRATYGTSYRAPNLRENFLLAQTGFNNVFDPCAIPDDAFDPITGYDPAEDDREQTVLNNCLASGVDPTTLVGNGNNVYSVEIASGGVLGLTEETSDSLSYGFSFEQPWFNSYDLSFGATYYEIDIENTIVEPTSGFIVTDCYFSENGNSAFCDRITRDANGNLDFIDAGFLNRDQQLVSGVDVNLLYEQTFTIAERPVEFGIDLRMNHPIEVLTKFTADDGTPDVDRDDGEPGFAEWNGLVTFRADIDDIRLTWQTRYIGSSKVEVEDTFNDIFDSQSTPADPRAVTSTCLGPAGNDVLCKDVGTLPNYFRHTASIYYRGDTWTFGAGIRNVFNEAPPQVDGSEILSINNTPIGVGYDLFGRTLFFNVQASF